MKSLATEITPPIILLAAPRASTEGECAKMSTERSLQSLLQSMEPAVLDECISTEARTLGFANLKPEQHRAVCASVLIHELY